MQILQGDAFHLNLLHQFLLVSIQCVQGINTVMRSLMCSRVVEHKERTEVAKCFLCGSSFHFLWLVHDDDGAVGCNHIYWSARVKIVSYAVYDTGFFVSRPLFQRCVEGLRVDNHHVDVGVTAVAVYLLQIATVINEIASLLTILLHEMVFEHGKTLCHSFTNGDTGHHNNKFGPPVAFVQLKHRLDVNVSLSRSRFHFYVE